jgi:hypothetical protein
MTARPTDDELRAMLDARADAVSPGAAREVLAAARTAIGGPDARAGAGVAFAPRPVAAARRRTALPLGAVGIAAAIVVAVAVLGGRVALDRPRATGPASGASPAAVGGASEQPAGSANAPAASGGAPIATTITPAELVSRLGSGGLDGRIVVVQGRLVLVPGRCLEPAPGPSGNCTFVQFDGLPDLFIDQGDRTAEQAQAAIERFGPASPVVLEGVNGGLRLVGWLAPGIGELLHPDGISVLGMPLEQDAIVGVLGWLQAAGGKVRLTDTSDVTGNGIEVTVDANVPPAAFEPALGTFLLQRVPDGGRAVLVEPRWEVVGRFDPQTTTFVDVPSLEAVTIHAADLMAAIKDGSLDGQLFAIDGTLQSVAWDCPLDAAPCSRSYVNGLPGVAITWNGLVGGSSDASGGPTSPLQGRLIVTPRHGLLQPNVGYLELIGVLQGDLDRPVPVDDLSAADNAGERRDPMGIEGVDGWLVVDGPMFCALQRPGQASTCPPGRSLLSAVEPDANGDIGSTRVVDAIIHKGAPGIGQLPIRDAGPFLVRQGIVGSTCHPDGGEQIDVSCAGGSIWGWIVGARYDPEHVRVVTFP